MSGPKTKNILFFFLSALLTLGYIFLIWKNFKLALNEISFSFGYVDHQNNWNALEKFIRFEVPYKDYIYEYGWFFLFLQTPVYLILGKTFFALLVSRFLFMPFIAVGISILVGRNILRKRILVFLFLLFLIFFRTNYYALSARHLMAELSLSFLIFFLFQKKGIYVFAAGAIAGLAVLTGQEYGIALNLTVFVIFLITVILPLNFTLGSFLPKFLFAQIMVLIPYYSWLFKNGALGNYWNFNKGIMQNIYYTSPCVNDSFPRVSEIQQLFLNSQSINLGTLALFFQRLNFYVVPAFIIFEGLVLFYSLLKKKYFTKSDLAKTCLVIYGLLIFYRTLGEPCKEYFLYGLVPFFLLLVLRIERVIYRKSYIFVVAIFLWLALTANFNVFSVFTKSSQSENKTTSETKFYSPAGWWMRKDLVNDYRQITDFITQKASKSDFIYVYPWGPYNLLAQRKSPTTLNSKLQFDWAGEKFFQLTMDELQARKPKYVVINLYNNLGVAHFGRARYDIARYFSLDDEDGPVFMFEGNSVEKFILENYKTVFNNQTGIVMKQREQPKILENKKEEALVWEPEQEEYLSFSSMSKTNVKGVYRIFNKGASVSLILEKPVVASSIRVDFRFDKNFFRKILTRYLVDFYILLPNQTEAFLARRELASREWQESKIYFDKKTPIRGLAIKVGENTGFAWWIEPKILEIKQIKFIDDIITP